MVVEIREIFFSDGFGLCKVFSREFDLFFVDSESKTKSKGEGESQGEKRDYIGSITDRLQGRSNCRLSWSLVLK